MTGRDQLPISSLWVQTDEPLFWLGGAGHETRADSRYYFDAKRRVDRRHYVLQFTIAGTGFHERGGRRTLLGPGMAFLETIPGPFLYGYASEGRWPYELAYVSFVGAPAEQWCARIVEAHGHVLDLGRRGPVEALMLSIAHQHTAGTLRDRYLISAQLYQLLMTTLSSLKTAHVSSASRLGEALALVEEHGNDPNFNITELARRVGCSREHLTRQFTHTVGTTPLEYLLRHRLRQAMQALGTGDDKLENLARECGFSSANYLCRAFRRRFGVTPAVFRRNPGLVTA